MNKSNELQINTSALPPQTHPLPAGIAELTAFHGPLPSWYRYDVGARKPDITPRRGFEMLVSAACYLANQSDTSRETNREARILLQACSQKLRDEVAEMQDAPEEMEAQTWQDMQIRWKRYRRMFGPQNESAMPAPHRGLKNWLQRWRGVPTIVAL